MLCKGEMSMAKKHLPVILLNGLILLPKNEVELDFQMEEEKHILEKASLFHEGNLLIVCTRKNVKQKEALPRTGIRANIKEIHTKDSTVHVTLNCIERITILSYLEDEKNQMLEGLFEEPLVLIESEPLKEAFVRKVGEAIELYSKSVDYLNSSVIQSMVRNQPLGTLVDMFATYLPMTLERREEYLTTFSELSRAEMLLEDIQTELSILELEDGIETKLKKQLDDNQKEYVLREKVRIIKEELGDISSKDDDIEALRQQVEDVKAPKKVKEKLQSELKKYEFSPSMSPEGSVLRTYIETLLSLPWKTYSKDNYDFENVRNILDGSHYGLDLVKTRIIEYLALSKLSNQVSSPIICFVGPPGTGKTSLAKSIAEAIKRKFVKISVGGVNDESELIGHRRTYIGANPGRIISGMKKVGVSNPVFLIDEIDKMAKDYKGDPASVLLEILDKEQNMNFSDNYVEESFDLSKVMFLCTANYLYDIPEALRDRLEIITLSGYTEYEKLDIVKRHILPKLLKEYHLTKYKITITEDAIFAMIRNYTKEAGVRELERLVASILRKIAVKIVSHAKEITFSIEEESLEEYLGKKKYFYSEALKENRVGVVNGLAYTEFGGDVLPIEVTYYKGKGNLILTGKLGDVMKESASIALSYIKSHAEEFGIDYELLTQNDIHIHAPEGAVPKDGPSAGITLVTALISAFTKKCVPCTLGMTGEITLRGAVLPIGGLKEKAMGAYRAGVRKVIIPKENIRDIDEVPKEIKDQLQFLPVEEYHDVIKIALKDSKRSYVRS